MHKINNLDDPIGNPFEAINHRLHKIEYLLNQFSKSKKVEQIPIQNRFLNISEAANLLGLKPSTVYKNSNLGLIPSIKRGGKLRFSELDLIEWLQSGRRKTKAELQSAAEQYSIKNNIIKTR